MMMYKLGMASEQNYFREEGIEIESEMNRICMYTKRIVKIAFTSITLSNEIPFHKNSTVNTVLIIENEGSRNKNEICFTVLWCIFIRQASYNKIRIHRCGVKIN